MRAKKDIFDKFINKIEGENDFNNLKLLLENKGDDKFFLGVREDYLSIYYMGMSIATVKVLEKGGCSYTLSYYYLRDVKDKYGVCKYNEKTKGYYTLSSDIFWKPANFNQILLNVRKHVLGGNERGYVYLEKVCQQWIINANNSNYNSDWYYIDMEYIYKKDGEKGVHPFGRADIIAIKRKKENGKHKVALVELKVGTGAYGVSIKVPSKIVDKNDRDAYRKKVVKNLRDDLWNQENIGVKLGSGLASHVVDFMQYFAEKEAASQLRKEIVGIVDVHKSFGLIDENCPLYNLKSDDDIDLATDIYIVTYSAVPGITKEMLLSDKARKKHAGSVKVLGEMKDDFRKYFFAGKGSSSLPIENLINKRQISGLLGMKNDYMQFKNNDKIEIECIQEIKNDSFRFVFRFIDISKEETDYTRCI